MRHGSIYQIAPAQMEELGSWSEFELRSARLSRPLLAGFYGLELICVMGLIPQTLLADSAYLWMIDTPAMACHRVAFVFESKEFIANMLRIYPKIFGHCCQPDTRRWLRWLGAEVDGDRFEILEPRP
jgi:hypothetical protein